ncbi:hypothetical protein CEXT_99441 [Caerostris extrusa]|uniref:Uncharacterized protein n=1 Tax=Caerostris extrusa TaxID=172846 RepID=A0AAV4XJU8_CAEEX|nr:hypothetical protein CEXT_99441 [Caerostris extrusa]
MSSTLLLELREWSGSIGALRTIREVIDETIGYSLLLPPLALARYVIGERLIVSLCGCHLTASTIPINFIKLG